MIIELPPKPTRRPRAPRASRRTSKRTLVTKRVGDLMSREIIAVAPHTLASHAERLAVGKRVHHLLVIENGQLQGVLCLCDLYQAEPDAVAAELMSTPPATIDSLAPATDAIEAMRDLALGCLPVLDGDDLVGVVTRGDFRRAGFSDDILTRTCASCGMRHHVRNSGSVVGFCMDCLDRGRAFDDEDPYDELGGDGD